MHSLFDISKVHSFSSNFWIKIRDNKLDLALPSFDLSSQCSAYSACYLVGTAIGKYCLGTE